MAAVANGDFGTMAPPVMAALPAPRRDPYEVLGVPKDATSAQIKLAYRKMALQFHPDKNVGNPEAPERFREIYYSYAILSDPEKRKQYDSSGFEGVDVDEFNMDIDLTRLGTFSTMFFAFFSKLGVPFKTSISIDVLEDALKGTMTITPLELGKAQEDKVEKQRARFYGVTITKSQAEHGVVVRVTSTAQHKFKLLYFEQEEDGSLQLVSQEDSGKAAKATAAGMYFLDFQVYQFDATANALAMAKNPDAAFFKRLEGLTPCEVSHLEEGTHVFAVYGDNFFRSASYTIEAVCAMEFAESARELQRIENELLAKKTELAEFEAEYLEALARFNAVTSRYAQEKQAVKDLLKLWHKVRGSFSTVNQLSLNVKATSDQDKAEETSSKDWWSKKNWFGLKSEKK